MAVRAREQALLAVYRQMATTFAQMHDSPVRMVAKGVLRGIVPWHQARPFLTARLRRRCMPKYTYSYRSHLVIAAQVSDSLLQPALCVHKPHCGPVACGDCLILAVHAGIVSQAPQ